MAKKRHSQQTGEITLDKPDFEQALSFAEEIPVTEQEDATPEPVPQEQISDAATLAPSGHADVDIHQSAAAMMPQDMNMLKVLQARALAIAKPAGQQQHDLRDQYLRFRLGVVERYGIPYQYLEELIYADNLARVPCTPAFVSGVVNHRGELLTILNLKQFFRMPAVALGDEARIIVVKHHGMRAGLLVDAVDGNEEYENSELSPPLSSEGVSNMEYVLGIHAGNVTLLNIKAILEDPTLRVGR